MYNSQYYTCEQIDERLLQGYLDDYNSQTGQSLTKAQFLTKLGSLFSKEGTIDNTLTQIGYYECDTAAGTAAKVITVANYSLFAGGSMKVKFVNKNTANNATLNINSQGAKALYYQGERASSTNSWDANEVVEIYYDGTSYYANNVKGGSGSGVYDVSKEHPTSGPNSDGKFTLDYILNPSNVNELIPVNKRFGGMSIMFVQSSDNKYVQYRLMATSFSTTPYDWQGVDEEPAEQSHNLPESWGVLKRILLESKYQEDVLDKIGSWTIRQDYTDKVGYSGDGHNGTITALVGGAISKPGRPKFDISNLEDDCYYIFTATIYSQNSLGYVAFGYDSSAILYNFNYLKDINGNNVEIPSGVSQTINVIFKKESGKNYIYTTVNDFAEGETINISNFGFTKLASFVFDNEPNDSKDAPHVLPNSIVSKELKSTQLNRLSLVGNGDNFVYRDYYFKLIQGHVYKLCLREALDTSFIESDSSGVLSLAFIATGDTTTRYYLQISKGDYNGEKEFLICPRENASYANVDHLIFGGRVAQGETLDAYLVDVTEDYILDSTKWEREFSSDNSETPLFEGMVNSRATSVWSGVRNVTSYKLIFKVNDFIHLNASLPDGYQMYTAIHPTFINALLNTSGSGRHYFGCGFNNDANKYSQYRWGDSDYRNGYFMISVAKSDLSAITDAELAEIKAGLKYEFYPLSFYGKSIKHEHQIASIDGKYLVNGDFEFFGTQSNGGRVDNAPERIKYLYQYISGSRIVNVDFDAAKLLIPTLQVVIQTCNTLEDATRNTAKESLTNNWVSDNQSVSFSDNSEVILNISFRKSDNSAFTPSEMAIVKNNVKISVRSNIFSDEERLMVFDMENISDTVVQSTSIISVPYRGIKYNVKLPSGIKARFAYGTSSISSYTSWVEENAFLTIPATNYLHRLQISNSDDSAISASDVSILLRKGDISISYKKTDALNIKERNYESEKYIKAAFIRMNYNDSQDAAQHGGFESMPLIAHTSDLHGDIQRFSNFIEYIKRLNVNVDAAVVSGDSVYLNSPNGSRYLKDIIDGLNGHKIIHCIGNHESYRLPDGTVDRNAYLFTNHIQPFADGYKRDANTDATMPYYYRDYSEKSIRVIVVNQYDNGCYYGQNKGGRFGQTQVTWICNTLLSTPADYGVVIVMHSPEAKVNTPQNMMSWNQTVNYDGTNEDETGYAVNGLYVADSRPLRTIIDAFISKQHLVTFYTENTREFNNGETVNIDVDFTQVNEGVEFICYMTGHRHIDNIGYVDGATNMQLMLNIVTGNCNYPHIGNTARDADLCDLPRGNYGSTQDAFNVYAIDRKAGNVKIARVGSNVNFEGIERKFLIAPYRD